MNSPEQLSQWVNPKLSEARISAQWSRIAERTAVPFWQQPVRLVAATALAAALVSVCVLLLVGTFRGSSSVPPPALAERENLARDDLRLAEGIDIQFHARTRWSLAERSPSLVRLSLREGVADFEVNHQDGRRVLVGAPGLEIEVVGTSFRVTAGAAPSASQVRVDVHRGTVRIRRTTPTGATIVAQLVHGGTSWADGITTAQPKPKPSGETPDASVIHEPLDSDTSLDGGVNTGSQKASPRSTAKSLFEEAEQARLKGRAREAAQLLERFTREYPDDPRAGLVAFELGRLRMDVLRDTSGAIAAFREARQRGLGSEFREDAEARLVRLYAQSGNASACAAAKKRYLEAFPEGRHAGAMRSLCGP